MILLLALLVPAERIRVDADGIPLPPGAVARLGSVRFRAAVGSCAHFMYHDGRTLYALLCPTADSPDRTRALAAIDTDTGRVRFTHPIGGEHDGQRMTWLGSRSPGVVSVEAVTRAGDLCERRFAADTGFPLGPPAVVARQVYAPTAARSPGGRWVVERLPDVVRRAGLDVADDVLRVRPADGRSPPVDLRRDRNVRGLIWNATGNGQFAVSPDDRTVAMTTHDHRTLCLYDSATGRLIRTLPIDPFETVFLDSFGPTGRLFAAADAKSDSALLEWDVATGRRRRVSAAPVGGRVQHLDGGRLLAVPRWSGVASELGLDILDAATGDCLRSYSGWVGRVVALDGRTVHEFRDGWLTPIDIAAGRPVHRTDRPGRAGRLGFAPDGRLIVEHAGGTRVWDADFRAYRTDQRAVVPAADDGSPDGRLRVRGDPSGELLVDDVAAGRVRFAAAGVFPVRTAFSHDSRCLATADPDGVVLVWDLRRPVPLARPTAEQLAAAVADLGAADAEAGFRAVRLLAAFPDLSLPALERVIPPGVPDERLAELVAAVDAPRYADRRAAVRELAALGWDAVRAMREALCTTPSAEARARLEPLVAAVNARRLSADELRTERAIEAVEWMANPAADALLARWAGGVAGRRGRRPAVDDDRGGRRAEGPAMILLLALLAPAEPIRLDADGLPLPPGAVARLGSALFRVPLGRMHVSPDGRTLFAEDCTAGYARVHAIDTASGRPRHQIDLPSDLAHLCHTGVRAAGVLTCEYIDTDDHFCVVRYDADTGFPLGPRRRLARTADRSVRLSPGGRWVVETYADVCRRAGGDEVDQVLRVGPAAGGGPPVELVRDRNAGAFHPIEAAASTDDRFVAVAAAGHPVRVFDPAGGRRVAVLSLGTAERATEPVFGPDGRLYAWVRCGLLAHCVAWDVRTAERRRLFSVLTSHDLGDIRHPKGGRWVAAGRDDDWFVHDAASGRRVAAVGSRLGAIAFTPDGGTGFAWADGWVAPVDVLGSKRKRAAANPGWVKRLAVAPTGRVAVEYEHETRVWEPPFLTYRTQHSALPDEDVRRSTDGRLVVPFDEERASRVIETATGRPRFTIPLLPGTGDNPLALSPDGRYLATAERDGVVTVWDLRRTAAIDRPSPARLAAAIGHLDSPDAEVGFRAVRELAAFPDLSLPALRAALPPAEPLPADRVARFVADLDAPRFADRDAAARELAALGGDAAPALRAALKATASAEVRGRLEALLAPIDAGKLLADELRVERAVEAVEWMATPAADALLARWAGGVAGRRLTTSAAAAAQRRAGR